MVSAKMLAFQAWYAQASGRAELASDLLQQDWGFLKAPNWRVGTRDRRKCWSGGSGDTWDSGLATGRLDGRLSAAWRCFGPPATGGGPGVRRARWAA